MKDVSACFRFLWMTFGSLLAMGTSSAQLYRVTPVPYPDVDVVDSSPCRFDSGGGIYLNATMVGSDEAKSQAPYRFANGLHFPLQKYDAAQNATTVWAGNSRGQAVGMTYNPAVAGSTRPVFWDCDGVQLLPSDGLQGEALDVNEGGLVVGRVYTPGANRVNHAVVWDGATLRYLPTESSDGVATAVNDAGTVVGAAGQAPAIWDNGELRRTSFARGAALGVSANGIVAGTTWDATGFSVFVWSTMTSSTIAMPEGFYTSSSLRVNSAGTIAGTLVGNDPNLAITLYPGVFQDGVGNDVNDLLEPTSSDWTIRTVVDIDESGRLLAAGRLPTDPWPNMRTLILTPVPEPASMAALGLGLMAVAFRRRPR